jgi:uncharacterized protein (TIGR00297 family)
MSLTGNEIARKIVHVGFGLLAFSLRFLGPLWSAVLAAVAVVNNLFVLPRMGGTKLYREAEIERGRSLGIILYPVTVLLLVLFFWNRLEVAAAVWGILAFGDGMAAVVGISLGRVKLPWNPRKSWAGTIAFFVFGTVAATALLLWTAPERGYTPAFALAVAAATTLFAAILESLPQGLDDNIGVPLVSGFLMVGLLLTEDGWGVVGTPELLFQLAIGAGINLVLAVLGFVSKSVNPSGMIAGFVLGTLIYAFLGWQGYLLLLAFFVLGTALTKLGYQQKAAEELAQEEGGRRGARHALANTGVAVVCAVLAVTTPYPVFFAVAFAAAFATAAADTAGSEIGQLWGRRTYLPTTFRPVPRGTEGAVSLEGTVAGILAGALLGCLGAAVGLYAWPGALVVTVAAFLGTTLESLAGAAFDKRALLDNEAMNFLNTLVGALLAGFLSPLVMP